MECFLVFTRGSSEPGVSERWRNMRISQPSTVWLWSHPKPKRVMGQTQIVPPVNIPIPTNIGSKMDGEFPYPKMGSQWCRPKKKRHEIHGIRGSICRQSAADAKPTKPLAPRTRPRRCPTSCKTSPRKPWMPSSEPGAAGNRGFHLGRAQY